MKSHPLHVRVTPEVLATLQAIARAERRPVATLIAILVDEALDARAGKGLEATERTRPVGE